MADHAPEAATYALRAARAEGDAEAEGEREWQIEHLPEEIRMLIVDSPNPH